MNSFLCLSLFVAVAAAAPKPQSWSYSVQDESLKPASWYDGSVSYAPSSVPNGYWPSYYSPSIRPSYEVSPKNWYLQKVQSVPVARSDESVWKVEQPASWSGASWSAPQWSAGFYSAGLPAAKVEKQVVAKKIEAPIKIDQVQPVVDSTPKLISYSTEISHDVPAKKEEVASIVAARGIEAPVAPVAPVQYSAWAGEVKPQEVKPASWAPEIKPAAWSYGPAPAPKVASWASEVKPASWAPEVKPATWSAGPQFAAPASWTSEVKPGSWASEVKPVGWTSEVKPASWSSWSEAKPWASYVSPVQPAFYGASWGQPTVSTNAHHAISAPWSSAWSPSPVAWTEPIQKRSERKPF